jgi:hypothetical protein
MTNIPAFNFPEFHRVAGILRAQGYNLVNPAELDEEIERKEAEASPDGKHRGLKHVKTWADCLRRDIEIVADNNCVGVIVMDGWENSQGAQFETYVAYKLRMPIYRFLETARDEFTLVEIQRGPSLAAAGVVDG